MPLGVVVSDVVAALGLIDTDFAIGCQVCGDEQAHIYIYIYSRGRFGLTVEILIRMDSRLQRSRPTRRVHTRRSPRRLIPLHPLHKQRDRVLGPSHTAQILSRAPESASRHLDGLVIRHHRLADVHVVRVQVVGDVAFLAGPGSEGLELGLGLAHVAVEVVEVAQGFGPGSGVGVGGVEALVVFDEDEDVVFAG